MSTRENLAASPPAAAICDPEGLHRQLAHWNRRRLSPGRPNGEWQRDLAEDGRMLWLEGTWIESFREEVAEAAAAAPRDEEGFVAWFVDLKASGPGQYDPLFAWLAKEADFPEIS